MKHTSLKTNLLLAVFGMGAMGAPLIAPLLTRVETLTGLSSGQVGFGYLVVSVIGALVGLVCGLSLHRTVRTTFVRAGILLSGLGCALLAVMEPGPGMLSLGFLLAACLVINVGRPMLSAANGVFADLWDHSPHSGLIILHMTNAFGKLAAPLVAAAVGTSVRLSGMTYAVFFLLLGAAAMAWPRAGLRELAVMERSRDTGGKVRLPAQGLVWACALMLGVIAGAESGATFILAKFIERWRGSPISGMDAADWSKYAVGAMLVGIVIGRVVFAVFSRRLAPRSIIAWCLAFGVMAVPAALASSPFVYMPALLLTGICFSATWPSFFAIAARAFPSDRTFLSVVGGGLSNILLMGLCNFMTGAIGTVDARLPWAFLAGAGCMIVFAVFLFATPWGRELERVHEAAGE